MKIYAIRDHEAEHLGDLAYLFYYEKVNEYCMEICEGIDPWDLPFVLDSAVRRSQYTLGMEETRRFISQRIVPKDRQNIGMILKDNGLEEYDEIRLLILADGRCAQDECYICPIVYDELPYEIRRRSEGYITAIYSDENGRILVGFADGMVGIAEWKTLSERNRRVKRLLAYSHIWENTSLRQAGTELVLRDGSTVTYEELRNSCMILPLHMDQFIGFAGSFMVSTQDVAAALDCTRQNVNDLVRRGRLKPLESNTKERLFPRRDLQQLQR